MSGEIGKDGKTDLIEEHAGEFSSADGGAPKGDASGQKPALNPKPYAAASRKKERLAAALRDNLKRRKAQMRGRRAMGGDDEDNDNS